MAPGDSRVLHRRGYFAYGWIAGAPGPHPGLRVTGSLWCDSRSLKGILRLALGCGIGPRIAAGGRAFPLRNHAEALGLDAQRRGQLAAEGLECDRGAELHDLALVEQRAQAGEELVGHPLAGNGHRLRVLEGGALQRREARAFTPGREPP